MGSQVEPINTTSGARLIFSLEPELLRLNLCSHSPTPGLAFATAVSSESILSVEA